MKTVKRRYNFRIYPTDDQAKYLAENFGFSRYAYNWALAYRQQVYVKEQRTANYVECDREFNKHKKTLDWLGPQHSSVVGQQSVRAVEGAFTNFFEKRAKFPKFKHRKHSASMQYAVSGFKLHNDRLYLAKYNKYKRKNKSKNAFKIIWSRGLPSAPTSVTIMRDASERYFVSFVCEVDIEPKPKVNKAVGLDLGIKDFLTDSDGNKVENPRHFVKNQKKLAKLQKELSRKKKGSNRRELAWKRVAKQHAKIADSRRDFLHKTSTSIVCENQVIAIEDLAVANMVKNRKLAKHISDVGFGTFRTMLESKCEVNERDLLVIDRFYPSSKTCSDCGWINTRLTLSDREWVCHDCGALHDRDFNAAKNILAVGLTESQNGRGGKIRHSDPSWVKMQLPAKRQPPKQQPF